MKARELAKRAVIYGLGLGIYAYELFIATVEGLGLSAKGFWGEPDPNPTPTPVQPEPEHVASNDPIEKARAEMLTRASRDFDRWNKMTPAERVKNMQARDEAWWEREHKAQEALKAHDVEYENAWSKYDAALDAWLDGGRVGPPPNTPEYHRPAAAEPIPQYVVGANFPLSQKEEKAS